MKRPLALAALLLLALLPACADGPSGPAATPRAPRLTTLDVSGASPVYSGPETDYQPDILRLADGTLMMVIERLNASNSGNLYVTRSADGGTTWTTPALIVGTSLNERHPAVVQHAGGSFSLFYMRDEGGGKYRIRRATSADGSTWTDAGMVGLGWKTTGEINPDVIVEADGSLTMTYHRLSGPAYIARSTSGGATWDQLKTTVSGGAVASLPRIAKRASDGRYIVTYQQTSGSLTNIYAKTSTNVYGWSVPAAGLMVGDNSHDAQPIVLEDGRFFVPFAGVQGAAGYNLYYKTSADGAAWSAAVQLTADSNLYDVEPHPILQGTPGHVMLSWGRQRTAGTNDYDIWFAKDVVVP